MKIALCLTGLIGSSSDKSYLSNKNSNTVLATAFHKTKKHIFENNDVDVFIHSWELDSREDILNLYKPKSHKFEKQIVFKDIGKLPQNNPRVQAHFSKWYSIMEVMKLKQSYEVENKFTYDLVIQTRFDLLWLTDINFTQFDTNAFYIPHTMKKGKSWGWPTGWANNEVGDFFFLSNSKNMDNFSQLYKYINSYLSEGCPTWNHISNHMLALYHLKKIKLLPNNTKVALNHGTNFELYRWKFNPQLKD
jgi:hypothetical protein